MRELPRDLVTILRTEARNQRTPPIDYAIAEDGGAHGSPARPRHCDGRTARLPASRTVTEEMVEALKRIRDTAMEHTITAGIPECGVFGCIAQDADWLMREITAAMEEGQ